MSTEQIKRFDNKLALLEKSREKAIENFVKRSAECSYMESCAAERHIKKLKMEIESLKKKGVLSVTALLVLPADFLFWSVVFLTLALLIGIATGKFLKWMAEREIRRLNGNVKCDFPNCDCSIMANRIRCKK